MKKTLICTLILAFSLSISGNAQDIKSILSGLAQTALGNKLTTAQSVIGTWKYSAPACALDSGNDDLLAKAGNSVASSAAESSLTKVYDKTGLNKCLFTFNENGTYSTTIGKIKANGEYTFNPEEKTITFKTKLGIKVTAKVAVTGSSMTLMFKADKLISAIKTITGLASNITKYAALIGSMAEKYDGLDLGFELSRQ